MVLDILRYTFSNGDHNFFKRGYRVNVDAYREVINEVLVSSMKKVTNRCHFTFHQNGPPENNSNVCRSK